MGSTYVLNAFALAKVVLILLCMIREVAILDNMAFLCASFLPKWLIFLACLIVLFVIYIILFYIHTKLQTFVVHQRLQFSE